MRHYTRFILILLHSAALAVVDVRLAPAPSQIPQTFAIAPAFPHRGNTSHGRYQEMGAYRPVI